MSCKLAMNLMMKRQNRKRMIQMPSKCTETPQDWDSVVRYIKGLQAEIETLHQEYEASKARMEAAKEKLKRLEDKQTRHECDLEAHRA